jgi:hypothetical protein
MKANTLRGPLIKSAIVLFIISMLAYFTSTSPGGSVWASMGTLTVTILRTVQWAISLVIALAVSLSVMIGIFLGAVALVNPASSASMFESLVKTLGTWFAPLAAIFSSNKEAELAKTLEGMATDLKKELTADIQAVQSGLRQGITGVESKVSSVASRLGTIEETAASLAPSEQVEALAEEVKSAGESLAEIKGVAESLKGKVEQAEKQVKEVSGETILGDLPSRLEALEQQEIPEPVPAVDVSPLEQEIASLKKELAEVKKIAAEAVVKAEKKDDKPPKAQKTKAPAAAAQENTKQAASQQAAAENEHRIFSYFDNEKDKKKVAELVQSTMKKDMSYKQVMDFVAKQLGGEKGKIITSHPSLSKDYIRLCRKNS